MFRHARSVANKLFFTAVQANASWLPPVVNGLMQLAEKENGKNAEFAADLNKMISKSKTKDNYENGSEQAIYLTWLKILDPSIDQQAKEKLGDELAQRYMTKDSEEGREKLGGRLSYMPSIVTAPILMHSPVKVISAYYEYQAKYGEISDRFNDTNFEKSLKILLESKSFSKQAKTIFINKLIEVYNHTQPYSAHDNTSYYLNEAIASWERNSLITKISAYTDADIKSYLDQFHEKLNMALENTGNDLRLQSEFGSLVFEKLLAKHNNNPEALTPIVTQFSRDRDMYALAEIYDSHQLYAPDMFKRHLVQLAKSTNDQSHNRYSSVFFSSCLKYLVEKSRVSLIAPDIAAVLSADYYAAESYAFSTIRKELFTYWMDKKPEQIIAIIKSVLISKKEYHETPVNKFFDDLSYAKMPESFYDKLVVLLSSQLTPDQFIRVYSAVSENHQRKLLSALIADEGRALDKLKELSAAFLSGDYSAVFPRKLAGQLQSISPALHQQVEIAKLFAGAESQDNLETDLLLLKKILVNKLLTHDERHTEVRRLKNLSEALSDRNTGACPVAIQMFNAVPRENWPDLFSYFDSEIIYWSFPEDERHLALFYDGKKERPAPRVNTWLLHQAEWEDILYGTLVAILPNISRHDLPGDVAHWALSHLDQAFSKSEEHFPGLAKKVLKKFFLDNLPNSMGIFIAIQEKYRDKYHPLTYFDQDGIYSQVASWLPENTMMRASILAKLLRVGRRFEAPLHHPFARNQAEATQTLFILVNTRKNHLVNFLEELSFSVRGMFFKYLYRANEGNFLEMLHTAMADLGKQVLPVAVYLNLAAMILSNSKEAGIDIFKLIDAAPNNEYLIKSFSEAANWQLAKYSFPYKLIFNIVQYYHPDQLQKVVFDYVQLNMNPDDLLWACSCIESAKKVTGRKVNLPVAEVNKLIDYFRANISQALRYPDSVIETMSDYIPNLEKLLLELIAKDFKTQDKLGYQHKGCLDGLVKHYGFSHINAVCTEMKLANCSKYLVEKFGKAPDILQQIDAAIHTYGRVFEQYQYLADDLKVWKFNDYLRQAMMQVAKEGEKPDIKINIKGICEKCGFADELTQMMPSLRVKTTNTVNAPSTWTAKLWNAVGFVNLTSAVEAEESNNSQPGL